MDASAQSELERLQARVEELERWFDEWELILPQDARAAFPMKGKK